jgi:hypothetical protein
MCENATDPISTEFTHFLVKTISLALDYQNAKFIDRLQDFLTH